MFGGCSSLKTVPLFNTSGVKDMTTMFNNCFSLQSVPQFDTSSVNIIPGNMFQNCYSLYSGRTSGIRVSINYTNSKLSATALNDVFSGLGTASGSQNITITNNPGATTCNRSIASGKLWTVVG
jgi:surface protein